mgnify:CR=1 FL=1
MADFTVIRHSLDLVLHLTDTTTGSLLSGADASFTRDGKPIRFLNKGNGHLILIDTGREDFSLGVSLPGYVPRTVSVRYEELKPMYPALELPMIPDGSEKSPGEYAELRGRLEGLTELEAVWLGENACMIRSFNPRRGLLTLFNPHHLNMDRVFYALVDPDREVYEALKIEARISDTQFLLADKLNMEFGSHFPVSRRVFGMVQEDGTYLLRLALHGDDPRWVVRCRAGEREWFQTVDTKSLPEPPLKLPNEEQAAPRADPAEKGGM